jgi:hypothetical protein
MSIFYENPFYSYSDAIWHPASGTGSWTDTWMPTVVGTITIRRVVPTAATVISISKVRNAIVECGKNRTASCVAAVYGFCLVAYSGGVDSVLLARIAHEGLDGKSIAVIVDSPSLPRRELQEALAIAEKVQVPVGVIQAQEFENANYTDAADETRG